MVQLCRSCIGCLFFPEDDERERGRQCGMWTIKSSCSFLFTLWCTVVISLFRVLGHIWMAGTAEPSDLASQLLRFRCIIYQTRCRQAEDNERPGNGIGVHLRFSSGTSSINQCWTKELKLLLPNSPLRLQLCIRVLSTSRWLLSEQAFCMQSGFLTFLSLIPADGASWREKCTHRTLPPEDIFYRPIQSIRNTTSGTYLINDVRVGKYYFEIQFWAGKWWIK